MCPDVALEGRQDIRIACRSERNRQVSHSWFEHLNAIKSFDFFAKIIRGHLRKNVEQCFTSLMAIIATQLLTIHPNEASGGCFVKDIIRKRSHFSADTVATGMASSDVDDVGAGATTVILCA
jgi:hypothetical protein